MTFCIKLIFLSFLTIRSIELSSAGFHNSCLLQPDIGSCKGSFPRWFYNTTSARCETFIYGGCQGNPNRFETRESCENACICDKCIFQPDNGPCEAHIPSYFYNTTSERCEQFIYGGCGGNNNRFETAAECVAHCSNTSTCPVKGQLFELCPSCQGTCDNPFVRCPLACNGGGCVCPSGQLVNTDANECVHPSQCPINCSKLECPDVNCDFGKPIIPLGSCCPVCACGGHLPGEVFNIDCNGCSCTSRGLTICTQIACNATEPPSLPSNETCSIEGQVYTSCGSACPPTCKILSPFPCTMQCVPGCQCPRGTILDEENQKCVEHCTIPSCVRALCRIQPDSGPCKASMVRYFWNASTEQCEEFNYGGCGGNKNRFLHRKFCAKQCACDNHKCPIGSQCRVHEPTGQAYCEPSCFLDNGGCATGEICSLLDATCAKSPCPPVVECLCPIEGQVYTKCGSACPPTCNQQQPQFCSTQCVAGCQCPNGTVLDEENNKCVKVDQCSSPCPPACSHEYCSRRMNRNKPCSRSLSNSLTACPDRCESTYCRACYYSEEPRNTPRKCDGKMCKNQVEPACLRSWAKCVDKLNRRKNKCRGDCITAENFRCYDYPKCNNLSG